MLKTIIKLLARVNPLKTLLIGLILFSLNSTHAFCDILGIRSHACVCMVPAPNNSVSNPWGKETQVVCAGRMDRNQGSWCYDACTDLSNHSNMRAFWGGDDTREGNIPALVRCKNYAREHHTLVEQN